MVFIDSAPSLVFQRTSLFYIQMVATVNLFPVIMAGLSVEKVANRRGHQMLTELEMEARTRSISR